MKSITIEFETELCELAYKYGTDKCPQIGHKYTPYYYGLLKDKRYVVKKVLELGIYKGASLRMWRDFFPNAQIYGADINDEYLIQEDRITSFKCDETVKKDLVKLIKKTGSDIDLFIDDGLHNSNFQSFACVNLMPLLSKNVIYVIEDVSIGQKVKPVLTDHGYDFEEFNFNKPRHKDSKLIVVRHKK